MDVSVFITAEESISAPAKTKEDVRSDVLPATKIQYHLDDVNVIVRPVRSPNPKAEVGRSRSYTSDSSRSSSPSSRSKSRSTSRSPKTTEEQRKKEKKRVEVLI